MPTVVNGIGTWYYGKNRIHRRKDVCEFCNAVGELTSYDTTLYFVVLFIPLFPLGRKRILEECPYCQKHRLLPLAQWEAMKAEDIARMLEALRADPDHQETILAALRLAMAYQDETLFNKLAGTLAEPRKEDAALQAQLGYGYSYFVHYPEAERAFRASLAVEDNIEIRQALALALLKQLRPEEARPYLQHILDQKREEECGLIYLLIEGYQAEGRHHEALEVMNQRDAAFPELKKDKDIQKQRKTSERYADSGKRVRPVFLTESSQAGSREGGGGARLARIIGPLVLLGAVAAYFGAALWMGQSRQVYLVNGFDKPYTVAVNGQEHTLQPGQPVAVRLAEGEVQVESRDPRVPLEATRCQLETPFFSRPFASRTYVLNPDQLAVVLQVEAHYAEQNPRPNQTTPQAAKLLHTFAGIDYEFAPFPATLKLKRGQTARKLRVTLDVDPDPEVRLDWLSQAGNDTELLAYMKQWLKLDPHHVAFVWALTGKLSDTEAIEYLRTGLPARPLLIEWHRAYQSLVARSKPAHDLRPEYAKLMAETNGHPDAVYLYGRLQDTEEADKLFRQAAAASPPSAYGVHAIGFDALARGQFKDAVTSIERALQLSPRNLFFTQNY